MSTPEELVEKGVCVSFSEARRLISNMSDEKLQKKIRERQWGRRPRKNTNIVWPKENHVIESVILV
jgi:hypothetical protein